MLFCHEEAVGNERAEMTKEVEPGKWEPTGRKLPLDLGNGFLSRSGWALVDDSARILC
jgi:hypothetical protein